ncbi:MAG: pyrroloquinoline quinone-dependent dehydrogenase [Bauldia sp.]
MSPEPENWLLPHGNYAAWMYSPLDQINTDNVGDLRVAFMTAIGGSQPASLGGQAPGQRGWPLVNNGMMYAVNAWGEVVKIDVSSGTMGRPLWSNDPIAQAALSKFASPVLWGDDVYNVTRNDMRMIRINGETGETVWEVSVRGPDNVETAERVSGGAIAVNGNIIFGAAGPGMRGWVGAFSAETGDLAWRFYTVPAPGEPGNETWADDHNAWLTGGAGVWTTPSYDPATNLVIFGTGEPQPWADSAFRPGDNLYSVSTVAVDADTGALAWYFQEIPHESWDYDTVNARMLYDMPFEGASRPVMGAFSRNGHYYTLDRTTGEFISAGIYREDLNWTAGIDPKTGLPVEYDATTPFQRYGDNATLVAGRPETSQNICPAFFPGAPTWWPPTYDPVLQRSWVQTSDLCMDQTIAEPIDVTRTDLAGNPGLWGGGNFWSWTTEGAGQGIVQAVDTTTGQKIGELRLPTTSTGGILGTAGGLLFMGHPDGTFAAYDKESLEMLWSFNAGTPITAPPISYAVNGQQFIAVTVGGAAGGPNAILDRASQIVVFAL